jgi:hypothetical protein
MTTPPWSSWNGQDRLHDLPKPVAVRCPCDRVVEAPPRREMTRSRRVAMGVVVGSRCVVGSELTCAAFPATMREGLLAPELVLGTAVKSHDVV